MQRRIAKDLLSYLPARVLPALAGFITVPIYTHLFSPAEFGYYVLALAATDFLLLATITGFGQAAVRFFSAYQLKSGLSGYFATIFSSVGLITLVTATTCAILLLIFRHVISSNLYPLLWAALFLYAVTACFTILTDILRGQEKSRWYSIIWVSQSYGGVIFGLILVVMFGMDIGGLIWGQVLGLFLPIPLLIWLTTRSVAVRLAHLNRSDLKQLWTFAMPYTFGNIAFWGLTASDRYIVQMFRGSYEVGLYGVATKMAARSIQLLVGLFILVPAPMICRLWEESGRRATEEALTAFTRMFFLIMIPAVFGLAVVAAPLLQLLADEVYFGSYPAIWLVACAYMGMGLSDLASSGSMVKNRTGLIARNQCVAAGTGLVLNFILVPLFGFVGAGLSAVISFFLLAGLQAMSSSSFLTWQWPLRSLWRVLSASVVMSASVTALQAFLPSSTIFWQATSLILSVLVGAMIYILVLWALREISPMDLPSLFRIQQSQSVPASAHGETGSK